MYRNEWISMSYDINTERASFLGQAEPALSWHVDNCIN